MKLSLKPLARPALLLLLIGSLPLSADDKTANDASSSGKGECCAADTEEKTESWPIRGVVESVLVEKQALLVKHEEIPGFMRAMTMMFQVDPALLPTIKAGDNITAVMKRAQPRGWLLEDVEITDP